MMLPVTVRVHEPEILQRVPTPFSPVHEVVLVQRLRYGREPSSTRSTSAPLSGRGTPRIRRVIYDTSEPVSRFPGPFGLPAFASWTILFPPWLRLPLRVAYC